MLRFADEAGPCGAGALGSRVHLGMDAGHDPISGVFYVTNGLR